MDQRYERWDALLAMWRARWLLCRLETLRRLKWERLSLGEWIKNIAGTERRLLSRARERARGADGDRTRLHPWPKVASPRLSRTLPVHVPVASVHPVSLIGGSGREWSGRRGGDSDPI